MPPTEAAAAAAPAPTLSTPSRPLRALPRRAAKLPRVVRRTYLKFRAYFVVRSVGSVAFSFTVVLRACVCELPHTHNTHTQQQQQNFIHGKQK